MSRSSGQLMSTKDDHDFCTYCPYEGWAEVTYDRETGTRFWTCPRGHFNEGEMRE